MIRIIAFCLMRRIGIILTGILMPAITGGIVLAREKQNAMIDYSKAAVVMPFESSAPMAVTSLLAETTQKYVITYLKKAALFSAVLTPEESVKQLRIFTGNATSHGQAYLSGVGIILPGELVCNDISGVSGAGGMGFGGEFWISKRFALGGEFDALSSSNSECCSSIMENGIDAISLSIGTSYHFARDFDPKTGVSIPKKLDPFLAIGASVFGGKDASLGQIYLGGGMNYWVKPTAGLRLEFRDHTLTFGDHMRTTKVTALHSISIQVGICLR
jgi:hypothetical protein